MTMAITSTQIRPANKCMATHLMKIIRRHEREGRDETRGQTKRERGEILWKPMANRITMAFVGRSTTIRMFIQNTLARNLLSQDPSQRWNDYLAAFRPVPADADLDLLLLWRRDDVPWPTPSG